jgi:hypothetical protein
VQAELARLVGWKVKLRELTPQTQLGIDPATLVVISYLLASLPGDQMQNAE